MTKARRCWGVCEIENEAVLQLLANNGAVGGGVVGRSILNLGYGISGSLCV